MLLQILFSNLNCDHTIVLFLFLPIKSQRKLEYKILVICILCNGNVSYCIVFCHFTQPQYAILSLHLLTFATVIFMWMYFYSYGKDAHVQSSKCRRPRSGVLICFSLWDVFENCSYHDLWEKKMFQKWCIFLHAYFPYFHIECCLFSAEEC